MNQRNTGSVWVPWACLPLLLLLNINIHLPEFGSFDLRLLQIPVALALSYRYGPSGFVAILIGCAPLLVSVYLGPVSYGDWPSLFVIVAHAAWLTLKGRWLSANEGSPPRALAMSLLLVAGSAGLYYGPDVLQFNWWGPAILYYAFFVLGLRAVPMRTWLNIAGLITVIGTVIALANSYSGKFLDYEVLRYLQLTDDLNLRWQLDRPGEFLMLLVFFWTGRWLGEILRAAEPSRDTLGAGAKLALGAAILYLGGPIWRGLVVAVAGGEIYDNAMYILSPAGSYHVFPLLALSLAITRPRGMLISAALVGIYYLLYAIAPGRSFAIGFGDFAVAIAFAALGLRMVKPVTADQARTFSWLPVRSSVRQSSIEADEWKRQHDEISNTVRRVMLSLLVFVLFCGLTLAASEDASIFGGSEVTLPFANTKIDFAAFLLAGPLILVGLTMYLHLFLQSAFDLAKPEGARPLPYIFNMDYPVAAALSNFLHYWLPVLLMCMFAWKSANLCAGYWLGLASIGMALVMIYLQMTRMPADQGGKPRRFARVMFFSFALLFAIQMAYGSALLKRPLSLDGENLSERMQDVCINSFAGASLNRTEFIGANLRSIDFRGASMRQARFDRATLSNADMQAADLANAKFTGADLRDANLSNADLSNADLTDAVINNANFAGADLGNVKGVVCERLQRAQNWKNAYRDAKLACGEKLPES